jgi:hypothetical protein
MSTPALTVDLLQGPQFPQREQGSDRRQVQEHLGGPCREHRAQAVPRWCGRPAADGSGSRAQRYRPGPARGLWFPRCAQIGACPGPRVMGRAHMMTRDVV